LENAADPGAFPIGQSTATGTVKHGKINQENHQVHQGWAGENQHE
jgi:hypothetical protein